ncbi:MAG TPA: hypothetical protein VJS85_01770 [Rhizomicrobium sp.]|nr:hypothetical protein [Rhizomicrobium sp.]
MKKISPLIFCLLLAGCTDTDWDRAMDYGGLKGSAEEPAAVAKPASRSVSAPPAAAAPDSADTGFCRSVAMQDAGDNGFDLATQQRVYARSYAQCLALGATALSPER